MITSSTIAERVAQLHATMAAQPPSEVMGAFAREQADLAAGGLPHGIASTGPSCPMRSCWTCTGRRSRCRRWSATARRSWCSTGERGALTATSPCRPARSSCSRSWPSAA